MFNYINLGLICYVIPAFMINVNLFRCDVSELDTHDALQVNIFKYLIYNVYFSIWFGTAKSLNTHLITVKDSSSVKRIRFKCVLRDFAPNLSHIYIVILKNAFKASFSIQKTIWICVCAGNSKCIRKTRFKLLYLGLSIVDL